MLNISKTFGWFLVFSWSKQSSSCLWAKFPKLWAIRIELQNRIDTKLEKKQPSWSCILFWNCPFPTHLLCSIQTIRQKNLVRDWTRLLEGWRQPVCFTKILAEMSICCHGSLTTFIVKNIQKMPNCSPICCNDGLSLSLSRLEIVYNSVFW